MGKLDTRSVDIRRAAKARFPFAGAPYGNKPLQVTCDQHNDSTASLLVCDDHIHCLGCGFHIQKRLDALAYLLGLESYLDALKVVRERPEDFAYLPETVRQTERMKNKVQRAPTQEEVEIYVEILHEMVPERKAWLYDRWIEEETIARNQIGHNGSAFVLPVFDRAGKLVTLRFRNDPFYGEACEEFDESNNFRRLRKIPKYRGWSGHNEPVLYPAWKLPYDEQDYIVVVEGEFDALLLRQQGVPAVTVTNGAGQFSHVLSLLEEFGNPRKRIIICGDRDEAGVSAARECFNRAKEMYEEVVWLQWPLELGKDISEFTLGTGLRFQEIVDIYGSTEDLDAEYTDAA